MILRLTGSRSRLEFEPRPNNAPVMRCPNISSAVGRLDWRPQIELEAGLKRAMGYFDNILGGSAPDLVTGLVQSHRPSSQRYHYRAASRQ